VSQDTRYAVVNSNHNTAFIMTFVSLYFALTLAALARFATASGYHEIATRAEISMVFCAGMGFMFVSLTWAMSHDGYNRAFWNLFLDISHPPLNDREYWELDDYDGLEDEQWRESKHGHDGTVVEYNGVENPAEVKGTSMEDDA